jgi:rubredoxin-NAD+ reductase
LSHGLHAALANRGVHFCFGTTATYVDRKDTALEIGLANGGKLAADVVLSAVGLRPDLRLAQAAGLHTARGIVVDTKGCTSAPDVFALGDCAEYSTEDGMRILPYVAPLMSAARAVARTLAGEPTVIELKPSPVIVKTLSFPMALMPHPAMSTADGSWHETQYGERIICRYYDSKGTMVGFGVAPQEATIRQSLLAELGSSKITIAA